VRESSGWRGVELCNDTGGVTKPLGRGRCTNCGRERVGGIGREIVEVASMDRTELSTPAFSRQAEIEVDQMFIGKMQSNK